MTQHNRNALDIAEVNATAEANKEELRFFDVNTAAGGDANATGEGAVAVGPDATSAR